jgi:Phage integrase, N-terminal SAM-like domain
MLNRFREYLQRGGTVKEKSIPYYCRWVGNAYGHCRADLVQPLTTDQKSDFLADMGKSHEEWQVKQAHLALRLFTYFLTSLPDPADPTEPVVAPRVASPDWLAVEDKLRERLRLKQRSYSREKTYLGWLRAFRGFCADKSPGELASADIQAFLSHLAVNRRVAAATQNQALNALVFLFRHVLEFAIGNDLDAVRAIGKRRLPLPAPHPAGKNNEPPAGFCSGRAAREDSPVWSPPRHHPSVNAMESRPFLNTGFVAGCQSF